jgi:hypothetical protein
MPLKLQHESVFHWAKDQTNQSLAISGHKGVKFCCKFRADGKGEKNGVFRGLTPEVCLDLGPEV